MDLMQLVKAARWTTAGALGTATTLAELHGVVPPWAQPALTLGCWGCGGVAAVSAAVWAAARLAGRRSRPICEIDVAPEEDLPALWKLAQEFFGDKVTSLRTMRRWVSRRTDLFYRIKLVRRHGRTRSVELDGYFCVLPLTRRAVAKLRTQQAGVNDLAPSDIAPDPSRTAGIYIGAVAARSAIGRGAALQGLRTAIHRMAGDKPQMEILARPVTEDGLRLADHFRLQPAVAATDGSPLGRLRTGSLERFASDA